MSDWLDTQTKAILLGPWTPGAAPPDVAGFSLVLLTTPPNLDWFRQAMARVLPGMPELWDQVVSQPCPSRICSGATLGDAMLGQFELICCNAVAVFLRDEVVTDADDAYLRNLFANLRQSKEFADAAVTIRSVPDNESGRRFTGQFLGPDPPRVPVTLLVPCKKSRIMRHWGEKIGAKVEALDR